jgi:hypothetical protein
MEKIPVSLRLPEDVYNRIEELSKICDVDKTRLMVNMLDEFSKTIKASKWIGVLQISLLIRDAGEKLKEWVEEANKKKQFKGVEKL